MGAVLSLPVASCVQPPTDATPRAALARLPASPQRAKSPPLIISHPRPLGMGSSLSSLERTSSWGSHKTSWPTTGGRRSRRVRASLVPTKDRGRATDKAKDKDLDKDSVLGTSPSAPTVLEDVREEGSSINLLLLSSASPPGSSPLPRGMTDSHTSHDFDRDSMMSRRPSDDSHMTRQPSNSSHGHARCSHCSALAAGTLDSATGINNGSGPHFHSHTHPHNHNHSHLVHTPHSHLNLQQYPHPCGALSPSGSARPNRSSSSSPSPSTQARHKYAKRLVPARERRSLQRTVLRKIRRVDNDWDYVQREDADGWDRAASERRRMAERLEREEQEKEKEKEKEKHEAGLGLRGGLDRSASRHSSAGRKDGAIERDKRGRGTTGRFSHSPDGGP